MGHQDGLVVEHGLEDSSVRFNFRFWFLEDSAHEGWTVLIADKTVAAKVESLSVDRLDSSLLVVKRYMIVITHYVQNRNWYFFEQRNDAVLALFPLLFLPSPDQQIAS